MISASVRSHATVNNEVSGSETGDIQRFPGGQLRIGNPGNSNDWSRVWRSDFPQEYETAFYQFSPGSSVELYEIGGGKAEFLNYGGGLFFGSGWETNPFTPNLI